MPAITLLWTMLTSLSTTLSTLRSSLPSIASWGQYGHKNASTADKRSKMIALLLIITPQLIALMIFWPGVLHYDHARIIASTMSTEPSEWHSLLWGYLASSIIMTTGTMGAYGIIQVLIQVIIECYSVFSLRKIDILSNRGMVIMAAVYGLTPTYLMYGLLWGTDTLFAVLMALVTTLMMEYERDHAIIDDKRWMLLMIIALFFMMQFRKNAVLIPVIIAIIIVLTSRRVKRTLVLVVMPLLLTGMLSALFSYADAQASPVYEALGAPSQQVGAVAASDGNVSEWALEEFEKTRPWDEWASDNEKEGIADAWGFLRAWADTGVRNPGIYVRAWADLMFPYWQFSVSQKYDLHVNDITDNFKNVGEEPLCLQDNYACYGGDGPRRLITIAAHNERTEWLSRCYESVVYSRIPILADSFLLVFFNTALSLWTLVITCILSARRRSFARWLIIASPCVYIMASLLLFSPIASFRYALEMYWSLPLLVAWSYTNRRLYDKRHDAAGMVESITES